MSAGNNIPMNFKTFGVKNDKVYGEDQDGKGEW
jgi:hypothetical protein